MRISQDIPRSGRKLIGIIYKISINTKTATSSFSWPIRWYDPIGSTFISGLVGNHDRDLQCLVRSIIAVVDDGVRGP